VVGVVVDTVSFVMPVYAGDCAGHRSFCHTPVGSHFDQLSGNCTC